MASSTSGMKPVRLHSIDTPNGQKVNLALEELGIPYEAIKCNPFKEGSGIEKLSLNQKIPILVDPNLTESDGKELHISESGAILMHLAEQYGKGKLLPTDPAKKSIAVQWLFWQMAGLGPMFGQYNHFWKYAPEQIEYAKTRYSNEVKRILGVLEAQLKQTGKFVAGDEYTVADCAIYPWLHFFKNHYPPEQLGFTEQSHPNVFRWHAEVEKRPATQKGMNLLPMD